MRIAPVKEELVFDQPPIWLYHDVITESQVERMKSLAEPKVNKLSLRFYIIVNFFLCNYIILKLKRAIIQNVETGAYETVDYRISKRYLMITFDLD